MTLHTIVQLCVNNMLQPLAIGLSAHLDICTRLISIDHSWVHGRFGLLALSWRLGPVLHIYQYCIINAHTPLAGKRFDCFPYPALLLHVQIGFGHASVSIPRRRFVISMRSMMVCSWLSWMCCGHSNGVQLPPLNSGCCDAWARMHNGFGSADAHPIGGGIDP